MDDFIVLGLIPGTDIQISFEMWLQLATSLIAGFVTVKAGILLMRIERYRQFRGSVFQTATD